MAEKLDEKELVTFKELLMANNYQTDALTQLLNRKRHYYRAGISFEIKASSASV